MIQLAKQHVRFIQLLSFKTFTGYGFEQLRDRLSATESYTLLTLLTLD